MGNATPRANVLLYEILLLSIFGEAVLGAEVFGEAVLGSRPRILDENGLEWHRWPRMASNGLDETRFDETRIASCEG